MVLASVFRLFSVRQEQLEDLSTQLDAGSLQSSTFMRLHDLFSSCFSAFDVDEKIFT